MATWTLNCEDARVLAILLPCFDFTKEPERSVIYKILLDGELRIRKLQCVLWHWHGDACLVTSRESVDKCAREDVEVLVIADTHEADVAVRRRVCSTWPTENSNFDSF